MDKNRFTDWWFTTEGEQFSMLRRGGPLVDLGGFTFTDIKFEISAARVCFENWMIDYSNFESDPSQMLIAVYDPDFWPELSVPKKITKYMFSDLLTWRSPETFEALDDNYRSDVIDLDTIDFEWDDPALSDEFVSEVLVNNFDMSLLGRILVDEYKADVKMPESMPRRLIPFINNCIELHKVNQK